MNRRRAENLFSAMTDIEEKYIEEAEGFTAESSTVTAHPGRKRWVALAACFVLILAVAFPVLNNLFNKAGNMKAENDSAESVAEQTADGTSGSKKSFDSNNGAGEYSGSRISASVPEDVKITYTNTDETEFSFEVIEYDFTMAEPWITVRFTNNTAADRKISPRFALMEVLPDGTLKDTAADGEAKTFDSVIWNLPANGGTYDVTYRLSHFDYFHDGTYALFLDDTGESPYRIDLELTFPKK